MPAIDRSRPGALLRAALGLAALLGTTLPGIAWSAAHAPGAEPHAGIACGDCHLPAVTAANAAVASTGTATDVATVFPAVGALAAPQETLCGSCHGSAREVSHPSGFVPDRALPAGFPLGRNGEMTCATCHVVHGERAGRLRNVSTASSGAALIAAPIAQGTAFCLNCHETRFFDEMADKGRSLHGSGHLDAKPRPPSRIDAYSLQCMVCHAENASVVGDGDVIAGDWRSAGGSVNHPIGSDYRQVASRASYWSPAMLPGEMLLPDGKVGCVTCHDGYGREHGRLLRPDTLCLDCHNK